MKYTTLNEIKKYRPCGSGWKKLLKSLNKTEPDNEPLSFKHILESNFISDAVWSLRVLPIKDQALFRADVVELTLHIFEENNVDSKNLRLAIETLQKFAASEIDINELKYNVDTSIGAANADYIYAVSTSVHAACASDVAYDVDRIPTWQKIEQLFIKHFCEE